MIKNKFGLLLVLATVTSVFSSCLKEGNDNIDPSKGTPNIVEFGNTGDNVSNASSSTYPRFAMDLGRLGPDESAEFQVNVSYSGVGNAPSDITVNLGLDDAALTQFNNENGSDYILPPSELYTIPATAVIKKGEKTAKVMVAVKRASSFDFDVSYALPLKIVSASSGTVSQNFGTAVYSFTVQNQYDGFYSARGYLYHPSSPRAFSMTKRVSTLGANSIKVDLGDLGASNYAAMIVIDPATNKLTITTAPGAAGGPYTQFDAGLPSSNPGYSPAWADAAKCNNTYDPATKTFYLRYGYVGGTGWRVTEEILTLQ